ncbi:MAG: BrnA antitoxin family protein [Lachnospiraceae bacterium]|nr:BrnA antitoxin family protein [Lachnospiraceae bacterium]MDE7273947.1 BrnA antitoxin family protein [Lachnospiraceae bacterium]
MAIVRTTIANGQKPTEAQIKEIEEASKRPIFFDEDAPELTPEQYAEMAAIAALRREEMKKPVISLRVSPATLEKARATGKGYTGFLSRLLDNAINDPDIVAKSL